MRRQGVGVRHIQIPAGWLSVATPRSAGAPAWSPDDLSGLDLWMDGADVSTMWTDAGSTQVSSDGQQIYQMDDKSPNAFTFLQTYGPERPRYKTAQQNGLSTVWFKGDRMAATGTFSQPQTLFAVVNRGGTGEGSILGRDGNFYRWGMNEGGSTYQVLHGGSLISASTSTPSGSYSIIAAVINGASCAFYLNGAADGTGNAGTNWLTGTELQFGGVYGSNMADGYVGELIVYDSVLSSDDRGLVHSYLSDKWSISLS